MAQAADAREVALSTVTPVYQGQDYLPGLVRALAEVRAAWEREGSPLRLVEAIFVDDSAIDGSSAVLERLRAEHPWVRVVTLARNFGQHPATVAGILHSTGHWVATLDEDLQHDPRHLASLLGTAVGAGHDVVYARPSGPVHGTLLRDGSSWAFKRLMAWATGNPVIRDFNSFRLMRGTIARAAASVCGHETYFDVALTWFSDRFATHPLDMVDPRQRRGGASGYDLRGLLRHARRLALSSQAKVLRLGAGIGLLAMLVALALGTASVVQKLLDPTSVDVRGWASLFVSVLFFGGVCSLLIGISLEYLTSVVLHAHGKPTFFVVDRSLDGVLREHFEAQARAAAQPATRDA